MPRSRSNSVEIAFEAIELSRRSGKDETLLQVSLAVGKHLLMVHEESPHLASRAELDGRSPMVIYAYIENVDAVIERAVGARAKLLIPAADQFWGDRMGRIIGPAGHE